MHEDNVRTRAFHALDHNPAYPIGPYRFRNRQYLIVTYRTDPHKLREVVPEPLQVRASRRNAVTLRIENDCASQQMCQADFRNGSLSDIVQSPN